MGNTSSGKIKTALYDRHRLLGAKFIDFSGWEMPLHYAEGVLKEHKSVRESAGIFDISHMGQIWVEGPDTEIFLDFLSTNQIAGKPDYQAIYTVWCNEQGGSIDDLIIYRLNSTAGFVIANAANRQKDLTHLQTYSSQFSVKIHPNLAEAGIIAIQGPQTEHILSEVFPAIQTLAPMHFTPLKYEGETLFLSKTGYTGAGGVEIFAPNSVIVKLWDLCISKGVKPVGLGARDTLRLEMGYALYGHELSEDIAPNESVSSWTVKWTKKDFLGKSALEKIENSSQKRQEYGMILEEPGIAREGAPIWKEERKIGRVTSGNYSPSLNKSIGIILVEIPLKIDEEITIEIRGKRCKARITKLPFLPKTNK